MRTRLKKVRKHLGLSQAQLAKELGIKQGSYSAIESGNTNLTQSLLIILEYRYSINTNWILTGEGEMFNKVNRSNIKEHILEQMESIQKYGDDIISGKIEYTPEVEKKVESILEMQKHLLKELRSMGTEKED